MSHSLSFLTYIQTFIQPTTEELAYIGTLFLPRECPKGTVIADAGSVCSSLFFIEKGAVRSFYLMDGDEITYWFATEGMFATSYYSFISRKIGFETIQALEDVVCIEIHYEKLQEAFAKYPRLETLWRKVSEIYYVQLEERTYNFQRYNAKTRYDLLLTKNPEWILRFSLGHISSYLGMSQETLSRIRARK